MHAWVWSECEGHCEDSNIWLNVLCVGRLLVYVCFTRIIVGRVMACGLVCVRMCVYVCLYAVVHVVPSTCVRFLMNA